MKSSLLASSRDRLYEVESLSEAWASLDKIYRQNFDIRKRLKQDILAIKTDDKSSPQIDMEIWEKINKSWAKIKAATVYSLLEYDF